jgi:hypothetical protein
MLVGLLDPTSLDIAHFALRALCVVAKLPGGYTALADAGALQAAVKLLRERLNSYWNCADLLSAILSAADSAGGDERRRVADAVVALGAVPMLQAQVMDDPLLRRSTTAGCCTLLTHLARTDAGAKALKALMDSTDRVHIKGPETDLRFSIKGIGSVTCGGDRNIPDGEVFSCPVKTSVEGHVSFNVPSIYQGQAFDSVRLEFSKGRIVKATANNTAALNKILDCDAGARFIGEFSLGFNPHILHPMRDILFDEKIAGSFHFTPGQAYKVAGNGNTSRIHWDMVSIQRPECGGGEVWFDGKLIRKDGIFTVPALKKLNPDYLLGKRA